MAREKYPYNAWLKLRNAKYELTTTDLDGLADITASAAEVNVIDGATAGTAVASKALVTDSSNAVSGVVRKVVAAPAGAVLNATHTQSVYNNTGAVGAGSWDLPVSVAGMEYYFYVTAAQELRINPNGTETIGLPSSGAQQAAGKYITANAAGEYVHILCVTDGQWETLDYRGTWTVEG